MPGRRGKLTWKEKIWVVIGILVIFVVIMLFYPEPIRQTWNLIVSNLPKLW